MRKPTPVRGAWSLRALGSAVVLGAVLGGDLTAAEPAARDWLPRRPVPPRGPFFRAPAVPNPIPGPNPFPFPIPIPIPNPFPPALSELGVTGATDRCLVIAPAIDPRSIKVAPEIDPGIFAVRPRVQGLPVRPDGGWLRR